jgi:DNA-binding GntR family transcriptional regulator
MSDENEIYIALRERLVNGGFAPNVKLKPNEIRLYYKCSASTIRETLFRLSTEGLVSFQEQRGFRVPQPSAQLQHELTHLRIVLECEGASLSIRLGGLEWEARLTAAHHKLSHIEGRVWSSEDLKPFLSLWTRAEQEFHETLISACDSQVLKATHGILYQRFRQQLINTDKKYVFIRENIEEHQGILDAALARDEGLIKQGIYDHLSRNFRKPMPPAVVP